MNSLLISLLRSKIAGDELDLERLSSLSSEELNLLYELSASHDVSHIVGAALVESGALEEKPQEKALFSKEHMLAVFRYRRLLDELNTISELFERESIAHIPLKGSVLRDYYPEPWMRTSCDIDILVRKEELDRAKTLLVDSLGYTYVSKNGHDISLCSSTGVHLELHFALVEDSVLKKTHKLLSSVWDNVVLVSEKKYTYAMTDEMFYFYHIVHMAKHFLSGGCGIKSFLDLWILETVFPANREKREKLISEAGLSDFEKAARGLVNVWLGKHEHDENTLLFEKFVFSGGAYGTVQNGVQLDVAKRKSKIKYLFFRIFPPYKTMENMYPSLKKRKILLPFYHIRRWCRVIFCGGAKRARAQISKCKSLDREEINEASKIINFLGLDKAK